MKKILAILLASLMALSFAACGSVDDNNGEPSTASMALDKIINFLYESNPTELALETYAIDIADADMLKAFTGLDSSDKISEVTVSEPMMSSQAYSLVLVRVKDAADAEEVATSVLGGINPRKWVCVEADDVRVMVKGDVVILYMVSSDLGETVSGDTVEAALTTILGGSLDKVVK